MLIHPAFRTVFARQPPLVKLIDLKTSTGNTNSYTYTNVASAFGSNDSFSGETTVAGVANGSYPRTPSESIIVVIVHGEDSATVYGCNSVTFGGVSMTELVDIGPAANLTNTSMYWTTGGALRAKTTDDCVVVFSEAITGSAIAVLEITNFGSAQARGVGSSTGTGGMPIDISSTEVGGANYLILTAMTCESAAGTETAVWDFTGGIGAVAGFELLYESGTAEMTICAGYAYVRQYIGLVTNSPGYINAEWSGAGAGSHAIVFWQGG